MLQGMMFALFFFWRIFTKNQSFISNFDLYSVESLVTFPATAPTAVTTALTATTVVLWEASLATHAVVSAT